MKRFFTSLVLFSSLMSLSKLAADTVETASNQLDDREVKAVREFINTKRQVSVKETGGNLSISGEATSEFQTSNERLSGVRQRAPGGATSVAARGFDVGFKLMFDYRTDRTWLAARLKFVNKAGLYGGTANRIKLDKAYWGAHLLQKDTKIFDVEMGRRNIGTIFDSKIEFTSLFDGVLIKYDQGFETIGNFYFHGGTFIIDQCKDHYGHVGELGLLEILNTGFYTKYSLIDWDTKHTTYSRLEQKRFDFLISQLILGYQFESSWIKKFVKFYLAALYNHQAKARTITAHEKAGWGGYAGFLIGKARKRGDWSFEFNYQVVEAQAIPDFDVAGIGIGNAPNTNFYFNTVGGVNIATTRSTAAGNANYRGYNLILNYLLTDNLNVKQVWRQSQTLDDRIGPYRRFKQYELDFIYAF